MQAKRVVQRERRRRSERHALVLTNPPAFLGGFIGRVSWPGLWLFCLHGWSILHLCFTCLSFPRTIRRLMMVERRRHSAYSLGSFCTHGKGLSSPGSARCFPLQQLTSCLVARDAVPSWGAFALLPTNHISNEVHGTAFGLQSSSLARPPWSSASCVPLRKDQRGASKGKGCLGTA